MEKVYKVTNAHGWINTVAALFFHGKKLPLTQRLSGIAGHKYSNTR
jgi:hypothetical protein